MKEFCKKISAFLKAVFGWGIMLCLFAGGFSFFGYLLALTLGGDGGAVICDFLYKQVLPAVIRCSTALVLLGLLAMYLDGENALTVGKTKEKS